MPNCFERTFPAPTCEIPGSNTLCFRLRIWSRRICRQPSWERRTRMAPFRIAPVRFASPSLADGFVVSQAGRGEPDWRYSERGHSARRRLEEGGSPRSVFHGSNFAWRGTRWGEPGERGFAGRFRNHGGAGLFRFARTRGIDGSGFGGGSFTALRIFSVAQNHRTCRASGVLRTRPGLALPPREQGISKRAIRALSLLWMAQFKWRKI